MRRVAKEGTLATEEYGAEDVEVEGDRLDAERLRPQKEEPDVQVLQSEGKGQLVDASTGEIMRMILGEEKMEDEIGRCSQLLDESEFDAMPPFEANMNEITNPDLYEDTWQPGVADVKEPEFPVFVAGAFEPAGHEEFPVFKRALKHFQATEPKARVVRVDTEETYLGFVADTAVKELERRINELRTAVEEHASDEHGGTMHPMRKWDEILGGVEAISKIQTAGTAKDATAAMPQVPLQLPEYAEGKVQCYRDGDYVVVSIRFMAADDKIRIATVAAKPHYDVDGFTGWALESGVDPVTILGVLPDLADAATGKRLLGDAAGAAYESQYRLDVCGQEDEPVLLVHGKDSSAPMAALMYTQQLADSGDEQAQKEIAKISAAASTPEGEKTVAPALVEAKTRLAIGGVRKQEERKQSQSHVDSYADTALFLGC